MVDIDDEVVEECKRHLPEMHQGAFDDPRTRLLHEDARAYLENTDERFDLIVVDLVEPLEEGPACLLFTQEFYTLIRDRLTDQGVMTMQAGMTKVNELGFFDRREPHAADVFPVVAPYQSFISCFGTPWGFILASKGTDPRNQSTADIDRLIAARLNPKDLGYWDGTAHLHAFNLPKFIRRAVDESDPRHHRRRTPSSSADAPVPSPLLGGGRREGRPRTTANRDVFVLHVTRSPTLCSSSPPLPGEGGLRVRRCMTMRGCWPAR